MTSATPGIRAQISTAAAIAPPGKPFVQDEDFGRELNRPGDGGRCVVDARRRA